MTCVEVEHLFSGGEEAPRFADDSSQGEVVGNRNRSPQFGIVAAWNTAEYLVPLGCGFKAHKRAQILLSEQDAGGLTSMSSGNMFAAC